MALEVLIFRSIFARLWFIRSSALLSAGIETSAIGECLRMAEPNCGYMAIDIARISI